MEAIIGPLQRHIQTLALTRWLSFDPVVCVLLLAISLHNLYPRSELLLAGEDLDQEGESDGSEEEGNRRVGAPQTEKEHRQQQRRRHRKMRQWLANPVTKHVLAVWLCVATPLMRLNYSLFKRTGVRPADDDDAGAAHASSSYMSTSTSPLLAVLSKCCLSIRADFPQHSIVWKLLLELYGPVENWPEVVLLNACTCLCLLMGNLWRRFYKRLAGVAPWSLWAVCDPAASEESRLLRRVGSMQQRGFSARRVAALMSLLLSHFGT